MHDSTMATKVAEYNATATALAELTQRYKGVTFQVQEKEGMAMAKAARAELRTLRTNLEKMRQEIKAPALERCNLIDSEAKRITAVLMGLENPIADQIKAEEKRVEDEKRAREEAEKKRVEALQARVSAIRIAPAHAVGKSSEEIAALLANIEATTFGDDWAEFKAEGQDAYINVTAQLKTMLQEAQDQEAERRRIEAERAELERLRAESEARAKAEAEVRAKAEAEARQKAEAEERAARERIRKEEERVAEERRRLEEERAAHAAQVDADNRAREEREALERAAAASAETQAQIQADVERGRQITEKMAVAPSQDVLGRQSEVRMARHMLAEFRASYGHLPEFLGVVIEIDLALANTELEKAA